MDSLFARTAANTTMAVFRPDDDYGDLSESLTILGEEAERAGTSLESHALAESGIISAACTQSGDMDLKIRITQKKDVPGGKTIVPPTGLSAGDIPANGYVVYLNE